MWSRLTAIAVLVAACVVVFGPVLGHEFVNWDDNVNIYENPYLSPVSGAQVARFWRGAYAGLYIPLTYTVWALVAAAQGAGHGARLSAGPFHAVNLLLHVLSALTVFALLARLLSAGRLEDTDVRGSGTAGRASRVPSGPERGGGKQRPGRRRREPVAAVQPGVRTAALAGALVFALHPVQVEAVAWVTGTKDVLSGLLSLVAVWQFIRLMTIDDRRGQLQAASLATAAFAMALLAKPAAVAVPLMAGALAGLVMGRTTGCPEPGRRGAVRAGDRGASASEGGHRAGRISRFLRRAVMNRQPSTVPLTVLLVWLALAGVWMAVTLKVQPPGEVEAPAALWARPAVALDALAFYLGKLVVPFRLGPDYGRTPAYVLGRAWGGLGSLVPCGLAGVLVVWCRRARGRENAQAARWTAAAAAVFALGLVPVLGLVPFAFQSFSTVSDRYLYLAMLGPAIGGGLLAARWSTGGARVALGAVLVACGVRSGLQLRHWRDTQTLFRHAIAVNPRSHKMFINMGNELRHQGRTRAALAHFSEAARVNPAFAEAYNNMGIVWADAGDLDKAVAQYSKALSLRPGYAEAHDNLGIALGRRGELTQAMRHFSEAIRINPSFAEAYHNLGVAAMNAGDSELAVAAYRHALALRPAYAEVHYNLANVLAGTGATAEAVRHYSEAIRAKPDYAAAHGNLAAVYDEHGQVAAALAHYSRAIAVDPGYVEAHYNMGLRFQEAGMTDQARSCFEQALRLRPDFAPARRALAELQAAQRR
ncbi:MAG: tetratricopeptide repeat protein [Kiritimatiellae bacterium]|nr:tetratricopeptide repeat protein [Kiritimatiellia bacterium]